MKCKNIECENETVKNKIYCSLTCRNIFVNKNLIDYNKVSNTFQRKRKEREKKYLKNPKKCLHCNAIIPYKSKENNYCNHSCFASGTNAKRQVTWGNKISESIHKYLVKNGIKEEGKVGLYDIKCKGCGNVFQKTETF